MTGMPKLTIKKPLSLNKQSQLFQALKPLHEQTKAEKNQKMQDQKQKEKFAQQKKNEQMKAALMWLYEQFPACFHKTEIKPLKLNIDKDIYPFLKSESSPSKMKLRDALTYYTNSLDYLKAVINGFKRYDLKGQQVQEISQDQKDYAQQKFDNFLKIMKSKKHPKNNI